MDSTLGDITLFKRVERLERQNQRLKLFATIIGLITLAVALMGQTAPKKSIEANEFVLRDLQGKVRGRWSMLGQNVGPEFSLFGENGKELVNLMVIGNMPEVFLCDSNGKERLTLSLQGDSPTLALRSANREPPEIELTLAPEGWGGLLLMDSTGNHRSFLVGSDAGARLSVYDAQGFEATLGTQELVTPRTGETRNTSAASLVLFDKDKNVIWKAP